MPAQVIEVSDNIILDFNHPLAGKQLTFKIKILNVSDESASSAAQAKAPAATMSDKK